MNREAAERLLKGGPDGIREWNSRRANGELIPSLEGIVLHGKRLRGVNFGDADLASATLDESTITDADLSGATLTFASLRGAVLVGTDFRGTKLYCADFTSARASKALFDDSMQCRGCLVDGGFSDSPLLKRHIQDRAYIESYTSSHPFRSWLWKTSCDFGRSYLRLAIVFLIVAVVFASIYWACPGMLNWKESGKVEMCRPVEALYYSVVTLTTLGFGDITARTNVGASVVMFQVITGYVLLGLLISVLADKVARRS